jgi:hypothetical protein
MMRFIFALSDCPENLRRREDLATGRRSTKASILPRVVGHELWRAWPGGQAIFVKEALNNDVGVIQHEKRFGAAEAGQRWGGQDARLLQMVGSAIWSVHALPICARRWATSCLGAVE